MQMNNPWDWEVTSSDFIRDDSDIELLQRMHERVGREFGHIKWGEAKKDADGITRLYGPSTK